MSNRIDNVEIFAAGTWNGDPYTVADLDQMIVAFNETKAKFKPYLKLGHDEKQKLLQKDGLPAAGWIEKVYRTGETLFADFVDIPQKVFELIQNKAYRKVSSEIYWNIEVLGKKYPYLISAVSLLGADTPAVTSLADILSLYGLEKQSEIELKLYEFTKFPQEETRMSKTENEIKLELDLKQAQDEKAMVEGDVKKFTQESEDLKAQLAEMQEKMDKHEAAELELKKAVYTAKLEKQSAELLSEKLVTPAAKEYASALLEDETKKEYTIGEKKFSDRFEILKEMLKLNTASAVNTNESSEDGQETKQSNSDDAINAKIEKYMSENKVEYKAAYKAVVSEIKPRASVAIQNIAAIEEK